MRRFILLMLAIPLVGCTSEKDGVTITESSSEEERISANGLCEHKVPAELCTKCNPKLAAVFKARGDWCGEHGVPESQCLQCNPNRTFDQAPEDAEGPADYCKEHGVPESMCTKCNPKLVTQYIEKGDYCREHGLPESVCPRCHPDLAKKAGVEIRFPEPGTKVRLASPELVEAAGFETQAVEAMPFSRTLDVVGQLDFNQNRLAQISPKHDARVTEVLVDIGDRVKAGQPVVVVSSAQAGEDRARLAAAKVALDAAKAALARKESLKGVASQREIDEARSAVAAAKAEYDGTLAALRASGAAPEGSSSGRVALTTPFDGEVVARDAVAGMNVEAGHVLLEVADVAALWANLEVPEEDAHLVRPGLDVVLKLEGSSGRTIEAKVSRVAASVDPRTRTVKARVEIDNADRSLKAGQFFRGEIRVSSDKGALLVPKQALQEAEGTALVFRDEGGGVYEPVPVELGAVSSDFVEVTSGIEAGDMLVTTGSFLLKTEILKDSIGAGCADD